jgi:regulator of cell morphogenesis and NO signaling
MTDTTTTSLADLVSDNPAAAVALERLGLDYCCHGDRSLADACAEAGLDTGAVARELEVVEGDAGTSWTSLSLPELVAHIVDTHHHYLHAELPALQALADKVLEVHGERHPELADVRRLLVALREDLEPHLLKEERVLFPAILALVEGRRDFPFGSVENPIRMMTTEHERTGELLAELRRVSGGHIPPDDACASYRSLYQRLATLEADTHLHVHKENHGLFPAAIRLHDA